MVSRLNRFIIILILICPLLAHAGVEEEFFFGYRAYKDGRFDDARSHFLKCNGKYPLLQNYIKEYLKKIEEGGEKFIYADPSKIIASEIENLSGFDLAKAYLKARRFKEAEALFRNLNNKPEVLEYLAISLGRQDKNDEAIDIYRRIIKSFPHNKNFKERAMFKIGFLYLDKRDYKSAIDAFLDLKKKFPSYRKHDAIWYLAWASYKLGQFEAAVEGFSSLEKDPDWKARALFWNAVSLEKLGKPNEAGDIYRTLASEYPNNFYSLLTGKMERAAIKRTNNNYALTLELAVKNDAWDIAFLVDPYPKAYPKTVASLSKKMKVDPFFIWAVMREESKFRADAVSRSGAIGLMQLMPATAERMLVSKEIAKNYPLRPEKLLDPQLNIDAGVRYLSFLLKRYHGNIFLTAAAYNAGEDAVDRWIKNSPVSDMEFVEEIPYRETQDYVRKVMRAYWIYKLNRA